MRERESLFNEYLIEVRKKEKEEKIQRRETVCIFFVAYVGFVMHIKEASYSNKGLHLLPIFI